MLSTEAIEAFKRTYQETYSEHLSDEVALELAINFLIQFDKVYRPIKKDWLEKFEQTNNNEQPK